MSLMPLSLRLVSWQNIAGECKTQKRISARAAKKFLVFGRPLFFWLLGSAPRGAAVWHNWLAHAVKISASNPPSC